MQVLGYIAVQPDWPIDVANAQNDVEGEHKFWVSAYAPAEPSLHTTVRATADALLVDDARIEAQLVSARQLRLSSPALSIPPGVYTAPSLTVACTQIARGTGVRAFDVTRPGGLVVAGGDDGALDVYETHGTHRVRLDGHLGDITACMFFPSGQVVLSGATDMQIKIWSACDGSNPVTLVGHTGAITDFCIIGVGKLVVSAAKDGRVKVWECGTSSCLHTYDVSVDPVNAIWYDESALVAACEDGRVVVIDPRSKVVRAEFGAKGGPPMRSAAFDAQNQLVIGGRADGVVCVWDMDNPEDTKLSFRRGHAAVSVIRLVSQSNVSHICVGTEDGQLYIAALSDSVTVIEDMVAFDVNPITQIRITPSTASRPHIWAAAQDSRVCSF
ncbi:Proteasomal ATPase-associated factor 1 [Coemansia sp. RSA 1822]|nr:Proteasomal ATPase-associated factor 1 [Coemansia sp. RSA 638]KAJ2542809.1 Proteasomal ATPase-associated factor 1 [Coemansia sp. RSA 1853]KAJ2565881.1 Proteasomal ATPase-associated factor 1 [Coemansia sp. RSA 1822]